MDTSSGSADATAGNTATAFRAGDHLVVFINDQFARELIIDRSRHYQRQDR